MNVLIGIAIACILLVALFCIMYILDHAQTVSNPYIIDTTFFKVKYQWGSRLLYHNMEGIEPTLGRYQRRNIIINILFIHISIYLGRKRSVGINPILRSYGIRIYTRRIHESGLKLRGIYTMFDIALGRHNAISIGIPFAFKTRRVPPLGTYGSSDNPVDVDV